MPARQEPTPEEPRRRWADLPAEARLEVYMATLQVVEARIKKRAQACLAEMEVDAPSSPQEVERGTKDDAIILSPAGKFQRLMDQAQL